MVILVLMLAGHARLPDSIYSMQGKMLQIEREWLLTLLVRCPLRSVGGHFKQGHVQRRSVMIERQPVGRGWPQT